VSDDGTLLFTLNNPLTREQARRVAEVLHEHGVERASFTAVQVSDGVRLEFRRPEWRYLSHFVLVRINEHPDADEAEALRELWNMAHEQVVVCGPPRPVYLPGEVKNERALRELARQWSDHPDYLAEWAEGGSRE
jgi:hypothetical protein